MALGSTELYTVVGVLVVILGVMLYNNAATAKARLRAAAESAPDDAGLLCKFAHHRGEVVGETVAVDGGTLILKQAGVFKAVPLGQAVGSDGEVRITGEVDWDQAVREGTAWHEAHTQGHDPSVTERLTRSEDVRAPALEAFEKRRTDTGPRGADAAGTAGADEEE